MIRTSNPVERQVGDALNAGGFTVLKNGWPDFLAFDAYGSVRFIEVKPTCRHRLSRRQAKMARALEAVGITVELIVGSCLCGQCEKAYAGTGGLHSGQHPDCTVCAPLRVKA